ncbi:MAG: DUF3365 domain-containing protein [Nitrospirae bacterium]|nr:MAG: DUF3365 domain-containing protein [Nitrospirota bacterium]
MAGCLRWIVASWLVIAVAGWACSDVVRAKDQRPELGVPLQTILELETTARLLAVLLNAGRAVVNDNQELLDDPTKGNKGFTPEVFEHQLMDMFRAHALIDLRELSAARLPQRTKDLLLALVEVSTQVVAESQDAINRRGVGFKGFIPAVFGTRVAGRFAERTGVRLKQTSLQPRNPANAPDAFEQAALEQFADPSHPRERVISEVAARDKALRLLFPLYATRGCLVCHGEPKGEPDQTGNPKEGWRLGQNAGAISVTLPVHR